MNAAEYYINQFLEDTGCSLDYLPGAMNDCDRLQGTLVDDDYDYDDDEIK